MASDEPEQLSPFDQAMAQHQQRRRDQLDLVRILADDSEPNEAMRALADEYRRDVAEGLQQLAREALDSPRCESHCGRADRLRRESKDTNPKDSVGIKKVPLSTVPAPVVAEVGLAMLEGARKYGRHNYRAAGVRASVYYDALLRHAMAWWEGEDNDPDSGLSHIVKAIACLVVLRDSMIQGNWIDDRPPVSPAGWLAELNARAAEIVERYPDAKPAHVAPDAIR